MYFKMSDDESQAQAVKRLKYPSATEKQKSASATNLEIPLRRSSPCKDFLFSPSLLPASTTR